MLSITLVHNHILTLSVCVCVIQSVSRSFPPRAKPVSPASSVTLTLTLPTQALIAP